MGKDEKVRDKVEELGGKAKEAEGKVTHDAPREAEGKAQQTKANLKQAGEKTKDAFKS